MMITTRPNQLPARAVSDTDCETYPVTPRSESACDVPAFPAKPNPATSTSAKGSSQMNTR